MENSTDVPQKAKNRVDGKMAEEQDGEINFLPTNTSEIYLHVEQLLQNTYLIRTEDLGLPKTQANLHVMGD